MYKVMYLYFWGQDIHLSDFYKKNTPKSRLISFKRKWGVYNSFFFHFFYPYKIDQKLTFELWAHGVLLRVPTSSIWHIIFFLTIAGYVRWSHKINIASAPLTSNTQVIAFRPWFWIRIYEINAQIFYLKNSLHSWHSWLHLQGEQIDLDAL